MKSRQLVAIVIIVVITAAFVNFLREGADWPLPQVLPGCDGLDLSPIHFLAGAVLIFLMVSGLRKLSRSTREANAEDTEPYDRSHGDQYEDMDDPEDEDYDENEEA